MKGLSVYLFFSFLSAYCLCPTSDSTGACDGCKNRETLSDANVLEMNSSTGMATNAYGLYSITLHTGRCVLQCSMLGYTTWSDTLQLSDNTVVDIALQPNDYLLKGVEVLGAKT